jgi:hypothetical protein
MKSEPNPTCAFHGAKKVLLSREGDSYRCADCGWRGDAAALLMQTEGIEAREAIMRVRSGKEGPSA